MPSIDPTDATFTRVLTALAVAAALAAVLAYLLPVVAQRLDALGGNILGAWAALLGLQGDWASLFANVCLPAALYFAFARRLDMPTAPAVAGLSFLALLLARWTALCVHAGLQWAPPEVFMLAALQTLAVVLAIPLVRHVWTPWSRAFTRRRLGFDPHNLFSNSTKE